MTSDLGGLWTAVLDLLGQVVMPDWAGVVTNLLPLAVAGVVVAGLGLLGRAWLRAWQGDPARGARRRHPTERRDRGPTRPSDVAARLLRPLALVPVGVVFAGLRLLDRGQFRLFHRRQLELRLFERGLLQRRFFQLRFDHLLDDFLFDHQDLVGRRGILGLGCKAPQAAQAHAEHDHHS